MIFIKYDENGKVTLVHHAPFNEKHGLGKTKKELELEGILVDGIPESLMKDEKQAVMYINVDTKEVLYEYVDIAETSEQTQQKKIESLEQQIQQQNQAISDLTMMIAMSQTPSV